jgi:2-acylglycerol O-acyltransferase 2
MCESPKSSSESKRKTKVIETPQDAGLIPTIAITFWMGMNGFVTCLVLYCLIAPPLHRNIIIGLFTASLILPPAFPGKIGVSFGNWIMKNAQKYFALKTTIENEQDFHDINEQGKTAIFACEPHDILPYSVFCFNPHLKVLPGRLGETSKCLMTGAVFNVPLMKQVYSWVGGAPVDKKTFRGRLQRKECVAFIPGGVQEVTLIDPKSPNDLILYLKNRKGFVKLALENGTPIVPVFMFHLDGSFKYLIPRGKLASTVARKIGFLPLIMFGRFNVPFGIPNPQKIHVVFGEKIDVPCEGDNVSNESVEKYHALYLQKLEELFEKHKHAEGYGNRTLKIM